MVKEGNQSVDKQSKTVGKRRQVAKKILPKSECLRKRPFAYEKLGMPTVVGTQ